MPKNCDRLLRSGSYELFKFFVEEKRKLIQQKVCVLFNDC